MGRLLSMATREELLEVLRERYQVACRKEKALILDEFQTLTGYHRKHAIRILNLDPEVPDKDPRCCARVYNEAVREVLLILWETAGRICSKRLKAAIPTLLESMEHHGHLQLDATVRERILIISPATMDRLLASVRDPSRAVARKRKSSQNTLKRRIRIRTFADWGKPPPGYLEADFVAHCGGSMKGKFVHTFVVTDIASGWTACIPLIVRDQSLVVQALDVLRAQLPFEILGLDTDNDSAFINETLIGYCETRGIEQTRSRPYKKNDQAHIEQKNGDVVRGFVGYERFEGLAATQALSRLFRISFYYVNFFLPSFKLKEKIRIGSKVKKIYEPPATPCDRLLGNDCVEESVKEKLRHQLRELDPVRLIHDLRLAQAEVAKLAGMKFPTKDSEPEENLDQFIAHLPKLWQEGEVRPTHRKPQTKKHNWRTREDPFKDAWPQLNAWLELEPDLSAKALLERLCEEHPDGNYSMSQLRTLQRRVREWRQAMVDRLLFRVAV